ncbi:hypothetical protein ACUNV4_14105 [Granulosicoccus sp. 3-233]|uniref:hypothetical protein n=1 Tax=Granulosicoccus sp. 3-233 TaxID=3417969 RepID=UPI003D34A27B
MLLDISRSATTGEPLAPPGPCCPSLVTDTAEAGGKWIDSGVLYDLDGAFIAGLAAAQLNPPEEWWNYCIECTIEDVGGAGGPGGPPAAGVW